MTHGRDQRSRCCEALTEVAPEADLDDVQDGPEPARPARHRLDGLAQLPDRRARAAAGRHPRGRLGAAARRSTSSSPTSARASRPEQTAHGAATAMSPCGKPTARDRGRPDSAGRRRCHSFNEVVERAPTGSVARHGSPGSVGGILERFRGTAGVPAAVGRGDGAGARAGVRRARRVRAGGRRGTRHAGGHGGAPPPRGGGGRQGDPGRREEPGRLGARRRSEGRAARSGRRGVADRRAGRGRRAPIDETGRSALPALVDEVVARVLEAP